MFLKMLGTILGPNPTSRFMGRENEILDYIDCISNEEIQFEGSKVTLKENENSAQKEIDMSNIVPPFSSNSTQTKNSHKQEGIQYDFLQI